VLNTVIYNWEFGDMVNVLVPGDWDQGQSSEGSVMLINGMQSLTFMDTTVVPELGSSFLPEMQRA
jgi:hypothetical protein